MLQNKLLVWSINYKLNLLLCQVLTCGYYSIDIKHISSIKKLKVYYRLAKLKKKKKEKSKLVFVHYIINI